VAAGEIEYNGEKIVKQLKQFFLQLLQMVVAFLHYSQLIFSNPCNIPGALVYIPDAIGISIFLYYVKFMKPLINGNFEV
jgi:hypothetical protein